VYARFLPLALVCAAYAQTPAFEVASVKLSEPITPALVQSGRLNLGVTIDATHVRISKLSLADLVLLAYQIKPYQYAGLPWMNEQRYDIQAALPEGGKRGQVPAMLQTLLAERFKLVIHRESRDLAVFALVTGKDGHRLKPTTTEAAASSGQIRGGATVSGNATVHSSPDGDSRVTPLAGGGMKIEVARMKLSAFANLLNGYTERPVLDMTGIEGAYDMEFQVSGEEFRNVRRAHGAAIPPTQPGDIPSDPAGVSLASSLQKLGLKLESRKAPVEVIVVDRAEKIPTEN
jgi:uncharacterized protein (TIGR03435 family)